MRRLFPSIIALLMVAGTLSAQTTDNKSTETTKKNREPVGPVEEYVHTTD